MDKKFEKYDKVLDLPTNKRAAIIHIAEDGDFLIEFLDSSEIPVWRNRNDIQKIM